MVDLLQDIRYSIRVLVAKPGFTLVAVLTIALGIGANTAIFSVINSVLLRPLPFDEPDQLTLMWTTTEEDANSAVSWLDFIDWSEQSEVYEAMAVFRRENHILTGVGAAERLLGARVSAGFFEVLGRSVQLGRSFSPEEDDDGSEQVAIISQGTWQTRFGGTPDVIGRSIRLNGAPTTVIGVLPPGFQFPADLGDTEVWTTMAGDPFKEERGTRSLRVVGRLTAEVSIEQAQAEMDEIAGRLEGVYEGNVGRGIYVVGLHDQLVSESRPALLILFAAVGAVLLIACANLASLLLARGTDRQREFSVRAALGAGRWRIARQLLTESTAIGLMGGALALLFALWGLDGLQAMIPEELVAVGNIELDRTVLVFAFGLSIATGLIFGLLPALAAANPDLIQGLKEGIRGTDGRSRTRLRSALVIAEVSMAAVLLVGAGLLLRSFWVLTSVDPGFDPRNAMTFQMSMPFAPDTINNDRAAFYDDVLLRISEISGVESASAITMLPMEGGEIGVGLDIVGREVPDGDRPSIRYNSVIPGYFRSMRIPMLQGRDFEPTDARGRPGVAIINRAMAERFWPDGDPMGEYLDPAIAFDLEGEPEVFEVVGIVENVHEKDLASDAKPQMYFSYRQQTFPFMSFVVRTESESSALIGPIRDAVGKVDIDQPIFDLRTMDDYLAETMTARRYPMVLLAMFAGLALLLALVGIYGVISYSVGQKTHEIGIRMALGAARRDILTLILAQGLRLTLTGVAVGILVALGLTRLMSSLLFGVGATDPVAFTGVPVVLSVVALIACLVPAIRAVGVEPMVSLRNE